jgi:hypothetical protein
LATETRDGSGRIRHIRARRTDGSLARGVKSEPRPPFRAATARERWRDPAIRANTSHRLLARAAPIGRKGAVAGFIMSNE